MKRELSRMIDWLVWAILAYALCIVLRTYNLEPQVQVILWKLGNLNIAAYCGYWIDRRVFTRIVLVTDPREQIRRAIVIAAAMISVGLGL